MAYPSIDTVRSAETALHSAVERLDAARELSDTLAVDNALKAYWKAYFALEELLK